MKRSKKQSEGVAVSLPDYVTLKQYSEVMSLEHNETIYHKIQIIATTINKTFGEVKVLPMEILPQLYNDCVSLYTNKENPIQAIKYKGFTLIPSLAYKKSIGEFCDLEIAMESKDINKICSVLFQKHEHKVEGKWIEFGDLEVIDAELDGHMSQHLDKYDYSNLADPEFFDDFPLSFYLSTVGFIVGIGTTFSIISKDYSTPTQKQQENLLRNTMSLGDGLASFSILQKLTSFGSPKKTA